MTRPIATFALLLLVAASAGAQQCLSNTECDDGRYCNGEER